MFRICARACTRVHVCRRVRKFLSFGKTRRKREEDYSRSSTGDDDTQVKLTEQWRCSTSTLFAPIDLTCFSGSLKSVFMHEALIYIRAHVSNNHCPAYLLASRDNSRFHFLYGYPLILPRRARLLRQRSAQADRVCKCNNCPRFVSFARD